MSTLGAVLQGLDRGVMNGLDLYKTIEGEARAKRQEQYAIARDARRDMEVDRSWENNLQRQNVEDEQWGKTFQEGVRKTNADIKHQEGSLGVARANAATSAGTLALSNRRFDDAVAERTRARNFENAQAVFGASLIGDDGQYITDNEQYAERMNSSPQAIQAMLKVAAGRGLIDPARLDGYTGAQLVPTPKGLALRVAGKDASGKPIKPGGGILSEGGTDDPNDPYVMLNIDQLRQMADPKFRDAQQSDALLASQIAGEQARLEAEQAAAVESLGRGRSAASAQVEASGAEIARLEAERAALDAEAPQSLAGTLKSKALGLVREVNPAVATLIAPEATMGHYGGTDVPAKRARVDASLTEQRSTLASAQQDVGYLSQREAAVPKVYADAQASVAETLGQRKLKHGEGYAASQRALDAAAPTAQKKVFEAAQKRYDKVVTNVISDNTFKPRKGELPPKVSAAQFRTMMTNVNPDIIARVGGNSRYEAAVYDVAEHVARSGITGDLGLMLEASAAGADLEAYTTLIGSPQYRDMSPQQAHAAALEVAKRKAANPDKDVSTLAGAAMIPR